MTDRKTPAVRRDWRSRRSIPDRRVLLTDTDEIAIKFRLREGLLDEVDPQELANEAADAIEAMYATLKMIEFTTRKSSLTESEQLSGVRHLVLDALG